MLPLTRHQQEKFEKTEDCKNCGSPFTKQSQKCRHHNHSTGQFIAAVCNSCNLQLKARRQRIDDKKNFSDSKNAPPTSAEDQSKFKFFIPVVFHNLSGYDSHHIFRYFNPRVAARYSKNGEKKFPPNVEIIALNLEPIHFVRYFLPPFYRLGQIFECLTGYIGREPGLVLRPAIR